MLQAVEEWAFPGFSVEAEIHKIASNDVDAVVVEEPCSAYHHLGFVDTGIGRYGVELAITQSQAATHIKHSGAAIHA